MQGSCGQIPTLYHLHRNSIPFILYIATYMYSYKGNVSVVKNQLNGMVEWNNGLEYWNGLINAKKLDLTASWISSWISDIMGA